MSNEGHRASTDHVTLLVPKLLTCEHWHMVCDFSRGVLQILPVPASRLLLKVHCGASPALRNLHSTETTRISREALTRLWAVLTVCDGASQAQSNLHSTAAAQLSMSA